ncbi:hypothetical protein COO60DRAFT_1460279 [Scenedesmus sp. NREL 46B-D3]|nr:hypothetical protein COO60DRAFT_1460279 [Scenedesmus sp. NREL 46B-D3]
MTCRCQGRLLDLPLEAHVEIFRWLDARSRWHLSSSCRACAAAGRLAPFRSVHAHVASDQVLSFSRWLQANGSRISDLHILGHALHSQHIKATLWATLSAPDSLQQLQHLQLDMPLSPEDEAAVLGGVCAAATNLASLHLHYQRPLSHARKGNAVCFCAHSAAAPWAAAAGQLRALRITGACFCNMGYITQLRGLTLLQLQERADLGAHGYACSLPAGLASSTVCVASPLAVEPVDLMVPTNRNSRCNPMASVSCCNTTNPSAELAHVLQQLQQLQQLTYTTSAPAAVDYAVAAALAAHSSLTHLELHNFVAPASTGSSVAGLTAAAAAAGLGGAPGAAASPAAVNALLGLALRRLQSLKLVDFSGTSRLMATLAAASAGLQLQQLQVARSRQDGFMPALLAGLFSDSDSDSDSEDSGAASNDADGSDDSSSDDCSDDAAETVGRCGGPGGSQHVNRSDSNGLSGIRALQQLQYLDVSHNQLRGVWVKQANQLSPACMAGLAGLTHLRDLEVAADVPAGCYTGFRGLGQLTRLVVQDCAAAEGLFLAEQGPSSSSSKDRIASFGCCFPHLVALGVMLRGPAGAAAMRQLATSCRDLRQLSIYQDLTTAAAAGTFDGCCRGRAADTAAAGHPSSWHCDALSGLPRLQQLSVQPPGDLRRCLCVPGSVMMQQSMLQCQLVLALLSAGYFSFTSHVVAFLFKFCNANILSQAFDVAPHTYVVVHANSMLQRLVTGPAAAAAATNRAALSGALTKRLAGVAKKRHSAQCFVVCSSGAVVQQCSSSMPEASGNCTVWNASVDIIVAMYRLRGARRNQFSRCALLTYLCMYAGAVLGELDSCLDINKLPACYAGVVYGKPVT